MRELKGLLTAANEVCEGYVFTGVCLSTRGRGSASRGSASGGRGLHPRGSASIGLHLEWSASSGEGVYIHGVWADPHNRILRNTGNERTVRILPECIHAFLSIFMSSTIHIYITQRCLKLNLVVHILNVQPNLNSTLNLSGTNSVFLNLLDVNLGSKCKLRLKMTFDPCVKNSIVISTL